MAPITLYCSDCKFSVWIGYPLARWYCVCPEVQRDLVNGNGPSCSDVRDDEQQCGREGKFFQKKPPATWVIDKGTPLPWWRRLFGAEQ